MAELRHDDGRTITYAGIGDEAGPSLAVQLAALARLDWRAIELRSVDGIALADLADRRFAEVADAVAVAGLDVVCVDSRIGNWARPITTPFAVDLAELDVLATRCAVLGTRYVRIMSYPDDGLSEPDWRRQVVDRVRALAGRAEQAGLVLLHENCAGWAGERADRMLHLLAAVDSPALRLLFDTGNGIAHGYRAADLLADLVAHVAHVHVKDAIGDPSDTVYTTPGAGLAEVARCLRLLLAHGYHGSWSIEPHLAFVPHEGDRPARDAADRFVDAGLALSRLVTDEVLPHAPGWSSAHDRVAG